MFSCTAVFAADHLDPPNRATGPGDATDIADFYAWTVGSGADQKLVMVLTFAGPAPVGTPATYDRDVLYTIHIDNTNDQLPNTSIYVRFAPNSSGDWGVQMINVPGSVGPITGPVNETLEVGGAKVFTGLRDDPFFFDLQGYGETLSTGTLSFDSTRDFFAGQNATAITLEVPISAALGVGNTLNLWAMTARIGGE